MPTYRTYPPLLYRRYYYFYDRAKVNVPKESHTYLPSRQQVAQDFLGRVQRVDLRNVSLVRNRDKTLTANMQRLENVNRCGSLEIPASHSAATGSDQLLPQNSQV